MLTTLKQDYELEQILEQLDNNECEVIIFNDEYQQTNKMVFPTPTEALSSIQNEDLELEDVDTNSRELTVKTDLGITFIIRLSNFEFTTLFSLDTFLTRKSIN